MSSFISFLFFLNKLLIYSVRYFCISLFLSLFIPLVISCFSSYFFLYLVRSCFRYFCLAVCVFSLVVYLCISLCFYVFISLFSFSCLVVVFGFLISRFIYFVRYFSL